MIHATNIRISIHQLMVSLLVISVLFSSLASIYPCGKTIHDTFSNKERDISCTDTQLPLEENEKEEESKACSEERNSSRSFLGRSDESSPFILSNHPRFDFTSMRVYANEAALPLYLTQHTLLI